ncbi:hypothetical protein [Ensifer aridi]|uniref:hypothetical protein n=1 Tax=Ensifer aridi TaxID=1708715 RepID=UPI00358ECA5A
MAISVVRSFSIRVPFIDDSASAATITVTREKRAISVCDILRRDMDNSGMTTVGEGRCKMFSGS